MNTNRDSSAYLQKLIGKAVYVDKNNTAAAYKEGRLAVNRPQTYDYSMRSPYNTTTAFQPTPPMYPWGYAPTTTVPDAPTVLSVTPGNKELLVTLAPPANDGGAPIIGYTINVYIGPEDILKSVTFDSSDTAVTITDLSDGTMYAVTAIAINSVGNSVQSALSEIVTLPTVPDAPINVQATAGNTEATITFTAPTNNGGSPILYYKVTSSPGNITISGESSPITVTGLTNGTQYTFTVVAVNLIGESTGAISNAVTPASSAPTPGSDIIYTNQLLIKLDAANVASYSGTGSTWNDIDGTGVYNATLLNSPTYSQEASGVLVFNGVNQYATIADNSALRAAINGVKTAQIWVNIIGTTGGIISKQYSQQGGYDGFSLTLTSNNRLVLNMNGSTVNGNYATPSNNVYTTSQWHLITVIVKFKGGASNPSKIYVDGTEVLSVANGEAGVNNTSPLELATGFLGDGNECNCKIGAFYYYNRDFTLQEIKDNYNATCYKYGLSTI